MFYPINPELEMLSIIITMLAGIFIGYFFRNVQFLQKTEKSISYTIFIMLFILGISVGSNDLIVNNLAYFGWQAFILASFGCLGSVIASWLVFNLFFKKEESL